MKANEEVTNMKIRGIIFFGLLSIIFAAISLAINLVETIKWWPILFALVNSTTLIIGLGTIQLEPFQRKKILDEVVIIAVIILFFFAVFGKPTLNTVGLDFRTFQVGGGILLALIAASLFLSEPGKLKITHLVKDPSTLGAMMACPGSAVVAVLAGTSNLMVAIFTISSVLCLTRSLLYFLGLASLVARERIEVRLVIFVRLSAILVMTVAVQDILAGLNLL